MKFKYNHDEKDIFKALGGKRTDEGKEKTLLILSEMAGVSTTSEIIAIIERELNGGNIDLAIMLGVTIQDIALAGVASGRVPCPPSLRGMMDEFMGSRAESGGIAITPAHLSGLKSIH